MSQQHFSLQPPMDVDVDMDAYKRLNIDKPTIKPGNGLPETIDVLDFWPWIATQTTDYCSPLEHATYDNDNNINYDSDH
jgi:hypothetical protein